MTSREEFFKVWDDEINTNTKGTKENPYIYLTSQELYDKMKETKLIDDNDMYVNCYGWTKVYVVKILSQEYRQLKLEAK